MKTAPVPIFIHLCVILFSLVLIPSAQGDWKIIPGKRIGEMQIGMDHVEVLRLLGAPCQEEDLGETERRGLIQSSGKPTPRLNGILQDDWITPLPISLDPDSGDPLFMCAFVTVYTNLKDDRIVQIEVHAPRFKTADGCSSESSALDLRKDYPRYQTTRCEYHHPSSLGIPAAKHFITFEDAVHDGIAWCYGAMGNLSPDPNPADSLETIIVHAPGEPALLDPDGGSRFIWKIAPSRRN